jgi:hypothetical protein
MFPPDPVATILAAPTILEVPTMAITEGQFNRGGQGAMFVPEEDVVQELPDGRQIQLAVKGAEIPLAKAIELGLVKESKQQGPKETKPAAVPSETKAEGDEPKKEEDTASKTNVEDK